MCVFFFFFLRKVVDMYTLGSFMKNTPGIFSPRRRASPTSKDNHSELIKARILFGY